MRVRNTWGVDGLGRAGAPFPFQDFVSNAEEGLAARTALLSCGDGGMVTGKAALLIPAAVGLAWAIMAVGPAAAQDTLECVDPATVADADFPAVLADLSRPELCVGEVWFRESDRDWHLVVVRNLQTPGPLWVVPHDEEDAAFLTAIHAVLRYGGVAVIVENAENRLVDGLDPNRNFAATETAAAGCDAPVAAPRYVEEFLRHRDAAFPVVGLHTNWNGHAGAGGRGTISINRIDSKMIPFPSFVAEGRFADEDTIVMVVSGRPPAENGAGMATVRRLNAAGLHVIYRYVTEANNDCTMADYLTLNGLGPYLNLEAEHGDVETHIALLDRVMAFVGADPLSGL